jgi:hypothetical protein
MRAAVKLRIRIPKDRRIQLPDELPVGQAELIVLYPEMAVTEENAGGRASRKAAQRINATRGKRAPRSSTAAQREPVSYFARLTARQPLPLSTEASRALDETDRGER